MTKELTKTQIDKLGDRLRKGNIEEADLRLLDLYRRSFNDAYEIVVGSIRKELALEPTGRPAKSTTSISDKLRRESIRLTQIQDIAGCRLIVSDIANQESVVQSLNGLFEHTTIVDRRQQPSHGYRAVHVIASCHDKMIEIQVRTSLQQIWAELSEKYSDVRDPAIKYGGGDETIQGILTETSSLVTMEESTETDLTHVMDMQAQLFSQDNLTNDDKQQVTSLLENAQERQSSLRRDIYKQLRDAIEFEEIIEKIKGDKNGLSD